jgi:SAM-dependent methyltransferase
LAVDESREPTLSVQDRAADILPNRDALEALFRQKHGDPESTGWAPRQRYRWGYSLPADHYEALVRQLVEPGCHWLDIGGGHAIFPDNPQLARELVARCDRVTAVDPSDNVHKNEFVHQRVQSLAEDYASETPFDLATMRMVVEHVSAPRDFVGALARLVKPGGLAVVFTINRWAPVSLISGATPFGLHHPIKKLFWGGDEEDTFPVQYRMNTRSTLRRIFQEAGFRERAFTKLDDLSVFGRFRWLNTMELCGWRCLKSIGLRYPENCLLGVYQRNAAE